MTVPVYSNGYAPENRMVSAGGGYDKYGRYDWLMTPGQFMKHKKLIEICKARTGHFPDLTAGYSAYRPYRMQVLYRNDLGIGAAKPGTSSHGGKWAGPVTNWQTVPTMAMDYHNWYLVFKNDRNAWYQAVRDAGLVPGQITVASFGADEPWHVIDLDPWREVLAGEGSTPFPEDIMTPEQETKITNKLNAVLTALGAMGLAPDGKITWPDSIMGNVRAILEDTAEIEPRVQNIDQQVTGADSFDNPETGFQSVAARVIEIQSDVNQLLSPEYIKFIADEVAKQINVGDVTVAIDYDKIAQTVRARFASDPLK